MGKPHQVEWDEKTGAAVNARRQLPGLVARYFVRGREVLAKDPSPAKMHRLRLATKRLRYSLELFRPCYGPGLETRMEGLRHVQQLLGEINDHVAAWRLLKKAMRPSPQKARVEVSLKERAEGKAAEFRKHWSEVFDAPGQERWWTVYLGREARTPGRRA